MLNIHQKIYIKSLVLDWYHDAAGEFGPGDIGALVILSARATGATQDEVRPIVRRAARVQEPYRH